MQDIQPLEDPRWDEFVERHPQSSVFHTSAWLKALRRTYGYTPLAMSTDASGKAIGNAMLFCRVDSWLTGHRLVSLPFSDHCEPLMEHEDGLAEVLQACELLVRRNKQRYLELRPLRPLEWTEPLGETGFFNHTYTYCFHMLDLGPGLETLFRAFHKDSTQRKIRRAEREKLVYTEGHSEAFIDAFYGLMLLTRRRHGLPPQPKRWFRNLADCFGSALKIRLASQEDRPVAAILTLRHKETMVYKYGCSDASCNNLGGTHLLFWKTIEEAKRDGLRSLDLGRSELANTGLITFKDRWGSTRSDLVYSRLSVKPSMQADFTPHGGDWKEQLARRAFSKLPGSALTLIGDLFYGHIG